MVLVAFYLAGKVLQGGAALPEQGVQLAIEGRMANSAVHDHVISLSLALDRVAVLSQLSGLELMHLLVLKVLVRVHDQLHDDSSFGGEVDVNSKIAFIHVEDDGGGNSSQLNDLEDGWKHVVGKIERHLIEVVAEGDGKATVDFRMKQAQMDINVFCRRHSVVAGEGFAGILKIDQVRGVRVRTTHVGYVVKTTARSRDGVVRKAVHPGQEIVGAGLEDPVAIAHGKNGGRPW